MGLAVWSLFILGAIAGQLVTVLNFWLFWGWDQSSLVEQAAHRGAALDIRDLGFPPFDPSPPSASEIGFEGNGLGDFSWWAKWCLLGLLVISWIIIFYLCCFTRQRDPRSKSGSERLSISEPVSPAYSLRDLALHQLAEVRLRRNGPHQ